MTANGPVDWLTAAQKRLQLTPAQGEIPLENTPMLYRPCTASFDTGSRKTGCVSCVYCEFWLKTLEQGDLRCEWISRERNPSDYLAS